MNYFYSFFADCSFYFLNRSVENFDCFRQSIGSIAFLPDLTGHACPDSVRNLFGPFFDHYYNSGFRHISHCHWMRRRGPLSGFHPKRCSRQRIYPRQKASLLSQLSFARTVRFRHSQPDCQNIGTCYRFFSQLASSVDRFDGLNHRLDPPVQH
jgi:hypothetical protein